MRMWIALNWLMIESSEHNETCVHVEEELRHQMNALLAHKEGHCSKNLIFHFNIVNINNM
jgi:hypothetical protein